MDPAEVRLVWEVISQSTQNESFWFNCSKPTDSGWLKQDMDRKGTMLKAHRTQLERIIGKWSRDKPIRNDNDNTTFEGHQFSYSNHKKDFRARIQLYAALRKKKLNVQ